MSLKVLIRQQFLARRFLLMLLVVLQLSILGSWMLSFPYEQWSCDFSQLKRQPCFPQIIEFADNKFFCQTPSPVLRVCNFYDGNWTLKPWLFLYLCVQYLCCVGVTQTQYKQHLMQLRFQYQGKLSNISSSFICNKNCSNELTFLSVLNGSKSNSHNSIIKETNSK